MCFTPGARTHRHRHPLSRTVYVTEGVGLCRRRGGPAEVVRPGDRVLVEAAEKHRRVPAFDVRHRFVIDAAACAHLSRWWRGAA